MKIIKSAKGNSYLFDERNKYVQYISKDYLGYLDDALDIPVKSEIKQQVDFLKAHHLLEKEPPNNAFRLLTEKDIDDAIDFLQSGKLKALKNKEQCVKVFVEYFAGEYAYVVTSADELRDQIRSVAGSKVYDWYAKANNCKAKIRSFATDRYQLKYRSQAKERVKSLTAEEAKRYLDELIDNDPLLGINILKGKG